MLCGALAMVAACGGGKGGGGSFVLLEFLESGKDNLPRNRVMTFLFSKPVESVQDFPERMKIENVVTTPGNSNFSRAVGEYVINGDVVTFIPRLPTRNDRSDAGFRANASYHVFLKGGPDSLASADGDRLSQPVDSTFDTNQFFEDPFPQSPPRAQAFTATDPVSLAVTDLSRLDPRPTTLATTDNKTLLDAGRVIEPGAGGGPVYGTRWQFDLVVNEPVDPSTVNTDTIEMFEVRNDALKANNTADPGQFGTAVSFKVPINVSVVQYAHADGTFEVYIRVVPVQTLVDDARYRILFSGNILGLDFRKLFIGDNGLTGDGQTLVGGVPYAEVGGLGYVAEFLVYDRAAIQSSRTVEYDPIADGIDPEKGQTATDPAKFNSSLYNPASSPSTAVGFLSAFGDGRNGNLTASGGTVTPIHTGDTANAPMGNPFTVTDLNPNNNYLQNTLPGGPLTYDTPMPYELQLENLTVSSAATLRFTGVNPVYLRVRAIAQIVGTISLNGSNGGGGGGSIANGGAPGAGGYAGATARQGVNSCTSYSPSGCADFSSYLAGCAVGNAGFPYSINGNGPGRGFAGGESFNYYATDNKSGTCGTGGGGASHATKGTAGEDLANAGGSPGTPGPSCSITMNIRNAGVVGVRGQPGATYGDREAALVLLGGSGGASGGSVHVYSFGAQQQAGGAGGGGGGSITVVAAGNILGSGAQILARGGDGGRGNIKIYSTSFAWDTVSGGGGGGAGGLISLISGGDISLAGALVDASGGTGGARGNAGTSVGCSSCNAGGNGGKGFIFLMDADGLISGFLPGSPGDYDTQYANGILTIRAFDASRFSSISAITELFPALAANPSYQGLLPTDIAGNVNPGQSITVYLSSSRADGDEPLLPDIASEIPDFEVAKVTFSAGAALVTITGNAANLNTANRDAFVRVRAVFAYTNGVEAALGPFASMDRVTIVFSFN
jgi:hypothetical protein